MNNKAISIVIPCYNEEKNIYQNVISVHRYLKELFETFEIIAVSDGSTDRTVQELKRAQEKIPIRVIYNRFNEGKGKVVKQGMLKSQYGIAMFMDADLAIPIEELEKFLAALDEGNDIAIASRFVPGMKVIKPVLWYRRIMEKVFRFLRMMIINNWSIQDTQCGFKVFRREAVMAIFPKLTVKRFSFDSEIIFIANKKGFKVKELPISLQNPAKSHIRIVKDSLNMFFDLLRIRLNSLLGKYN